MSSAASEHSGTSNQRAAAVKAQYTDITTPDDDVRGGKDQEGEDNAPSDRRCAIGHESVRHCSLNFDASFAITPTRLPTHGTKRVRRSVCTRRVVIASRFTQPGLEELADCLTRAGEVRRSENHHKGQMTPEVVKPLPVVQPP